jgi:hypothetical protein
MNIGGKSLRVARGKIVEPTDLVSLTGELVGKRRAEESRGSSNEKIHSFKIISETNEINMPKGC